MATRFGAYSAQPFVPPADYGAPAAIVPPADYKKGNKKSHYPFSTFPDSYSSSKNTSPTKEEAVVPPVDYKKGSKKSHYPFSTFPDSYNSSKNTSPTKEEVPSEPPVDYNSKHLVLTQTNLDKSPSEAYGHGAVPRTDYNRNVALTQTNLDKSPSEPYGHGAVPLPDYNSPKSKQRVFGDHRSRYGPKDFSQQRSIGVPVLPPMDPNAVDREPGKVGAGQNRAWLHHLKNHRKFDTLNSFRSVDDCPICQAMDSTDIALTMRHRNRRQTYQSPIVTGQIYQPPQGPIFESPREIIDRSNVPDYGENKETLFMQKLNSIGVVVARAVQDRVARKPGELTVVQGELLEILDAKKHWWSCSNMSGEIGWVPATDLHVVKRN